jgi:2-polyprenyl-6-methoxyphenol hydroxylase-like FAD-dependent oxidoreductase
MAGIYRSGNHAEAKAYFMFRSAPLVIDHRDTAQHKRLVSDVFGGESSWHVKELLAGALEDPDFYFDALSQVQLDSWSSGRVALVGDAAYCASPAAGAGAELAMVGAYRLAGELAAADGDHRLAFPRYEDDHRDLVRAKQRIGPNVRLMVPRTELGRRVRDGVARLPLLGAIGAVERLLGTGAPALPAYARGVDAAGHADRRPSSARSRAVPDRSSQVAKSMRPGCAARSDAGSVSK